MPAKILGEREFQVALHIILNLEKGVVNHPFDHGHLTNLGVTQAIYDEYRTGIKGLPAQEVTQITKEEAIDLYRCMFWEPSACPFLHWRLALLHFDTAVQRGPVKANRMLQEVVGARPVDGIIGPKTLGVIAIAEEESILRNYLVDRERHYMRRIEEEPSQAAFKNGWMNRLANLKKELDIA